ncbi:heat shock protein HspQ, partial [archaeon]
KLYRGGPAHPPTLTPISNLASVHKIRSLQENIPHTHAAVFSALSRFSDVIFNIDQLLALRFQTKGLAFVDALYVHNGTIKAHDVHPNLHRHLVRTTLPTPVFNVGQVVEHKQFKYRGVVVGYDMRPLQDVSQWEGVLNLPLGQEQVFYKIIPDDRDVDHRRTYYYVAQENLHLVEEPSRKLVQHKELEKYFLGYDVTQGVFIVPHKLKYCFPKGEHMWGEKYPEQTGLQRYREKHGIEGTGAGVSKQQVANEVGQEEDVEKLKVKILEQEVEAYEEIDKCLLTIRDLVREYLFNFIQTIPSPVVQPDGQGGRDESSDSNSEIVHPPPLSSYATRHTQDLLQLLNESPSREAALGIENVMWSAHVLSKNHNAMIAMRLGISELKRRNVSQAVRHFKRCVEFDPSYTEAYNKLAVSYQSVGEFERCKEEGQKAVKLMPHHYGACAGMALAYQKKGRYAVGRYEFDVIDVFKGL